MILLNPILTNKRLIDLMNESANSAVSGEEELLAMPWDTVKTNKDSVSSV